MLFVFLSITLLGGVIGWVTNKIAIKMLFKPVKPVKIGFFTLQGVFPKRQKAIAKSLGKIVESELLGIEDLKTHFISPQQLVIVQEKVQQKLDTVIKENIPPMLLSMAGGYIQNIIDSFVHGDPTFFQDLINTFFESNDSLDIQKIVEEKVKQMDFQQFEQVLYQLIDKELKHIEYLGAFLGLLIGAVQGVFLLMLQ